MYKPGEKAVMPRSIGVVEIKRIERRTVGGKEKDFYVVGAKVATYMLPMDTPDLRRLSSATEIQRALRLATQGDTGPIAQTWNTRYKEYMERISTGSISDIAQVFRALTFMRKTKDLSFGERKMLETTTSLIIDEVEASQAMTRNEVETLLLKAAK